MPMLECMIRDNFEKFNFPFENKCSFTVSIEDSLADTWQNCIETIHGHGEPKIVLNGWGTECDRIWKVQHGDDIKIVYHSLEHSHLLQIRIVHFLPKLFPHWPKQFPNRTKAVPQTAKTSSSISPK